MSKIKFSKEFEEQMIQLQMDHLRLANLEVCQLAIDCLALFDNGLEDRQWSTNWEVTRYRLFGACQMKKNVILCMFKEWLGLGPKYYQIIALIEPNGWSCIQCLTRMLPHDKMVLKLYCMKMNFFKGPIFPNQEKIRAIYDWEIPLEEQPNYCNISKTTIGHF